jgi:hypothetical protein
VSIVFPSLSLNIKFNTNFSSELPGTIFAIADEPLTWPGVDTHSALMGSSSPCSEEGNTEEDPVTPITPLPNASSTGGAGTGVGREQTAPVVPRARRVTGAGAGTSAAGVGNGCTQREHVMEAGHRAGACRGSHGGLSLPSLLTIFSDSISLLPCLPFLSVGFDLTHATYLSTYSASTLLDLSLSFSICALCISSFLSYSFH